jgi:hypothetical protein
MKIALCFIINYEHILNKEDIWREWIEPNKDIINVYFFYKDINKIKSQWILQHTIPPNRIAETSYYHVIPAYLSIMNFAFTHDTQNTWFCMLTDSCCPIISPKCFRYLFYKYYGYSFFSWKQAWWNTEFHKRANLAKLPKELWLANEPWFTLTRENVKQIFHFVSSQQTITKTICKGGLANESLFAIIFKLCKELEDNSVHYNSHIISMESHAADWKRMSSRTSPHIFKHANEEDIQFLEKEKSFSTMFIRKIAPEFPDKILRHYIYEYNKEKDNKLVLKEPFIMIMNRYSIFLKKYFNFYFLPLFIAIYIFYIMVL